jgi:hypothetical protein
MQVTILASNYSIRRKGEKCMNLELIWTTFLNCLNRDQCTERAWYTKIVGIPFLYIKYLHMSDLSYFEKLIKKASSLSMRGKQLHSETIFVREDAGIFIFRHRFFVPQRKMFCCGNLCPDCIRFDAD